MSAKKKSPPRRTRPKVKTTVLPTHADLEAFESPVVFVEHHFKRGNKIIKLPGDVEKPRAYTIRVGKGERPPEWIRTIIDRKEGLRTVRDIIGGMSDEEVSQLMAPRPIPKSSEWINRQHAILAAIPDPLPLEAVEVTKDSKTDEIVTDPKTGRQRRVIKIHFGSTKTQVKAHPLTMEKGVALMLFDELQRAIKSGNMDDVAFLAYEAGRYYERIMLNPVIIHGRRTSPVRASRRARDRDYNPQLREWLTSFIHRLANDWKRKIERRDVLRYLSSYLTSKNEGREVRPEPINGEPRESLIHEGDERDHGAKAGVTWKTLQNWLSDSGCLGEAMRQTAIKK